MIRKLPQSVINQIAAGQVIQRPVNVIKQLIENSIDANATQIIIQINNGGLNMIKIIDNGKGIPIEDYPLLCVRFATSKIKNFEDLKILGSFGFRGQALASLSYVSHLTVASKNQEQKLGFEAIFKDQKIQTGPSETPQNVGTKICAKDLFFNINNRRASLNPSEEKKRIIKLLSHFCLHYPRIKFSLQSEKGDQCLPSSKAASTSSIGQCKMQIFQQITKLPFDKFSYITKCHQQQDSYKQEQCQIQCILSKLNSCKGKTLLLNINNRIIQNTQVFKSVDNAYSMCYQSVHQDVQNYYVYLNLKIDPRKIDCNVHPTKKSVGLFGGDQFYQFIKNFVLEKIKQQSAIKIIIKDNNFNRNNMKILDAFHNKSNYTEYSQKAEQGFKNILQSSQFADKKTLVLNQKNAQYKQKVIPKTSNANSKSSTSSVYAFQKNRTDSKQLPLNYFLIKSQNSIRQLQKKHQSQQFAQSRIYKKSMKVEFPQTQSQNKDCEVRRSFQKMTYVGCYGFNYILVHYENKLFMMNTVPIIPIFIQNRIKQQNLILKKIEEPVSVEQIVMKFLNQNKLLPNPSSAIKWIIQNPKLISQRYGILFEFKSTNLQQKKSENQIFTQQENKQLFITHYPCLDQIFTKCHWSGFETQVSYLLCRVFYAESLKQHNQYKFQKFMEKFLQSQFCQRLADISQNSHVLKESVNNCFLGDLNPFNDKISAYFKDHVIPVLKIKTGTLQRNQKNIKMNKTLQINADRFLESNMKEMLDLKDVYKIFQRC